MPTQYFQPITIMLALWRVLFILSILSWTASANPKTNELSNKCSNYILTRRSKTLNTSDCNIEWSVDGSPKILNCVVHLSIESPPNPYLSEGGDDSDPDSPKTGKNLAVPMNYIFKFLIFEPEESSTDGGSDVSCLKVLSVRYERLPRTDDKRRHNFSLSSGIFNVIRNTETMFSDADLVTPTIIGTVKIYPACTKEKKTSSCILEIGIKFAPSDPGSIDDVNAGIVDFSITSFGYSHISGLLLKFSQYIFADRTRKGKILLKHLPGENIIDLRMPHNQWTTINDLDIPDLPKLEYLDLSLNDFGEFHSNKIGINGQLKELNFSESNLKKIPPFIANQTQLTVLSIGGNPFEFEGNNVSVELAKMAKGLHKLEWLNISGINIRYFDKKTLPVLNNLKSLDASNCKTVAIEEGAFEDFPSMEWIDLSQNLLIAVPQKLFTNLKKLKYVDLSKNKIREGQGLEFYRYSTADWLKMGMEILNMSGNSLESVDDLIAPGSKIKCIDLSENALKDLKQFSSYPDVWVQELNLSKNSIPAISEDVAGGLHHVNFIHLTDNKFDCGSCDMPFFQHWLNVNSLKKLNLPPDAFICEIPTEARKKRAPVYNSTTYYKEPCKPPNYELYLGGSFSGIALLASLIGGVFYLFRFEISYVLHMLRVRRRAAKGEGKPHSECIYDAFVSYSGRDRNWVLRVLQPGLEDSNQKYQLCLHDRNFLLGRFITQNIVDSIDKSRKTILILSENFVESQWCRWEMEMANHKLFNDSQNFLVLIELERLDRSLLSRHLRFLMETRTYLEWPSASSTILDLPETKTSEEYSMSFPSITVESSSGKKHNELSEQAYDIFWRRLYEALGDSLYVKEQKAKRDAEIAIQKTKEREVDAMDENDTFYTTPQEEDRKEETAML